MPKYGPQIVTRGLVLCLDAASTKSYPGSGSTWYDLSGNGNNGTLVNTPTFSNGNRGSFSFDAASDEIQLPNNLGYVSKVSAFAWFKFTANPFNSYHIIFGSGELEISSYFGQYIRVGLYTTSGRFVSNHGSGLNDGNWHYGGFTFDGSTKTAYIDGQSVGTQAVTGNLTYSFGGRKIGSYSGGYGIYGNIANAVIYDYDLSTNDVRQNFNATRGRFGV